MVLAAYALDVLTNDECLLLVRVGGLQRQQLTHLVLAVNVLRNLAFVLAYQAVGGLHYVLRRTVILL